MREIKAYIRPQMLDAVADALESRRESPGLTVSDVRGWGHLEGEEAPHLTERVKVAIVVPDHRVDDVVSLIVDEAHTGHSGDGKIFVSAVQKAVRIRTGEKGESAVVPSEHLYEGKEEG